MRTLLPLLCTLFLTLQAAFAQTAFRSALVLSGGVERGVYWDITVPHFDLGYNYNLGGHLILNAGLGFNRTSTTSITGNSAKQTIRNIEPNAHLLVAPLPTNYRCQLKIGAGIRQMLTYVKYTPQIVVKSDQVLSASQATYRINKPTLDIVAENDYRINSRFFIGLQLGINFFKDINSIQPLSIEIIEDYGNFQGKVGITTHPLPVLHALLRIGYVF